MTPRNTAQTSSTAHVAVYTRISSDPYGQRAGVTRQRADCISIAETRWPKLPVVFYEDNDKSAYSGKPRPGYIAMCDAIKHGAARAVVAWDQDRLLRLPKEMESLIELCEGAGMTNLVTAQGDLDLTTYDGQFTARIKGAVAKKSSDDTSRRVRRAMADKRERGEFHGGKLPYGVTAWLGDTVTVDPYRQGLVRDARDRILAGEPLARVHASLRVADPDAPATPKGLRHAMMTGPLLDAQDRANLTAYFTNPARRSHDRPTRRSHWLTGLVFCDVCGGPMGRKTVRGGRQAWTCRGGLHVAASVPSLDAAVESALFDAGDVQVAKQAVLVPAEPDVDADSRLSELAAMYGAGDITRAEWLAARDAALPATVLPQLPRPEPVADLEASWPTLDMHQRAAAASALLVAIRVKPAPKLGRVPFDPSRLVFDWRDTDD